ARARRASSRRRSSADGSVTAEARTKSSSKETCSHGSSNGPRSLTEPTLSIAPPRPRGSGGGGLLALAEDVHHPGHAELVGAHAERVAPRRLLEGDDRRAAVARQLLPPAAQRRLVVAAERDRAV